MPSTCYAVIVAAGSGERMGGDMPKQYQSVGGIPILRRSVLAFLSHPLIAGVLVVINPSHRHLYDQAVEGLDVLPPVFGGATRQESSLNGLEALSARKGTSADLVMIHDAARPFVSAETITAVHGSLASHSGAIAARRVVDTLKRSAGDFIAETVNRDGLWSVATPQGFRFPEIIHAHRAAIGKALTDDAAVAELAGMKIALVPMNPENMKITSAGDMEMAEKFCSSPAAAAVCDLRVGSGFDVHRLIKGNSVRLCGVSIPHNLALEGHSDADVALHAVVDAMLGAVGAGDIGSHFPPSDPQWRGADSEIFVRHAVEIVKSRGGNINNVDVTLMCEQPRIGPHRDAMAARLADMLGISPDRASVKATTTERLGFTGRNEGIAAQASVTVIMGGKR